MYLLYLFYGRKSMNGRFWTGEQRSAVTKQFLQLTERPSDETAHQKDMRMGKLFDGSRVLHILLLQLLYKIDLLGDLLLQLADFG